MSTYISHHLLLCANSKKSLCCEPNESNKSWEKLKNVLSEKDIQRNLDTLIGTQCVRRIGSDVIQNNTSHTPLPELPENLKSLVEQFTKI